MLGIGLARRVDIVPGSRTYDLIYARVVRRTYVPPGELSFGVSLDRAAYSIGLPGVTPSITVRMTLKNTTPDPLHLTFPMNPYDLEIKNEKGDVVYRWSNGRVFPQIVFEFPLEGEKDYVITAPLAGLPPGKYVAQAWLVAEGPPKAYSASAPFQIK